MRLPPPGRARIVFRHADADADADACCESIAHGNAKRHTNPNRNAYAKRHTNPDCDTNTNGLTAAVYNAEPNADRDRHSYSNAITDPLCNPIPNTDGLTLGVTFAHLYSRPDAEEARPRDHGSAEERRAR